MLILALDTSGPVCGVAVCEDMCILYEGATVNHRTHSANLMPMIDEALTRAGIMVAQVDLFAAVVGPGSFTGVRIGVSTAKGLAHGAGKPCIALAAGVDDASALICPIQDARAGQVYGGAFTAGMPPLRRMPNEAEKLDVYLDHVLAQANDQQRLCFVGDGVATYKTAIEARLSERAHFPAGHLRYLRPAGVALLAYAHRENEVDYLTLQPHYLRAPQAERAREAKLKAAQV